MRFPAGLASSVLLLAACASAQSAPGEAPAAIGETVTSRQGSAGGLEFARTSCAGCHAVEALWISPNPEAPSFDAIANMSGLSSVTLKEYLRDSHNFPEIMSFDIEPGQVDALAAYMVTLRKRD